MSGTNDEVETMQQGNIRHNLNISPKSGTTSP